MGFYQNRRWLHLRDVALRRDAYTDQLDLRLGERNEADTVHHILPREIYPEYQYKLWNLISLTRDNHELMHNRITGGLSAAGRKLMIETAEKNGISLTALVLVVGLQGSGKTTYVRQHIGNGVAYDLDHIAGAFRLRREHEEYHPVARQMANSMAQAFAEQARQYGGVIHVIRSAPTIEEVVKYEPDKIIWCKGQHNITKRKDYRRIDEREAYRRLVDLAEYCKANDIPFEEI